MDDWKPKIDDWQTRLDTWQSSFDEHYAALARKRRGWFRKLSAGELAEIAAVARKAAGEDVAVELFAFLSALCDAYIAESLTAPRAKVRAWIGAKPTTLNAMWSYAEQSIDLVRKPSDEAQLRRALAAVSIHDLRTDVNVVRELLARAWISARKGGIDPKPHFDALAALSNHGMGGGGAFTARTLAEFGDTAYFRDHVKPQLPRASA